MNKDLYIELLEATVKECREAIRYLNTVRKAAIVVADKKDEAIAISNIYGKLPVWFNRMLFDLKNALEKK
jgi:hypothetical protein